MTEIRCKKCNRLLMKSEAARGEIKCGKCGFINHIDHNIIRVGSMIGPKVKFDAENFGTISYG